MAIEILFALEIEEKKNRKMRLYVKLKELEN